MCFSVIAPGVAKNADDSISVKSASLGMGLAAINDWSTQNPFIDLMKQSRAWHNWAGGSNQFVLDKNDWPLSLVPQQEAGTVFLVSGNKPLFEQAIVLYEGEGD